MLSVHNLILRGYELLEYRSRTGYRGGCGDNSPDFLIRELPRARSAHQLLLISLKSGPVLRCCRLDPSLPCAGDSPITVRRGDKKCASRRHDTMRVGDRHCAARRQSRCGIVSALVIDPLRPLGPALENYRASSSRELGAQSRELGTHRGRVRPWLLRRLLWQRRQRRRRQRRRRRKLGASGESRH